MRFYEIDLSLFLLVFSENTEFFFILTQFGFRLVHPDFNCKFKALLYKLHKDGSGVISKE